MHSLVVNAHASAHHGVRRCMQVHSLVVNARSERTGRLCNVIFANDITGTRKAPDPLFSKARDLL